MPYQIAHEDEPDEYFNDSQKKLLQKASTQVKKEKIAPLSKATQTKNNGEHASLSVFPDGVAQNIASFLTLRETACVASVCKTPEKPAGIPVTYFRPFWAISPKSTTKRKTDSWCETS